MTPRKIFTAEHEMFRDQVRRFVEREIAPHHREWEHDGIVPRELWRRAGAQGLLCTMLAEEYGGAGGDFGFSAIIIEEIARSKAFTEAKIFALITAVSCTFMVMQAAELAMSMGILHTTGAPANWCHPFSFADVNKGFQVVFDFLI
jgi:alkylation response protein AidB-like acyl-CoA dehydrogenase